MHQQLIDDITICLALAQAQKPDLNPAVVQNVQAWLDSLSPEPNLALCELVDAPEPWLAAPDSPGWYAFEGGYIWQPASTFRAVVEVVPEHRVLRVKSGLVVSNYVGKWHKIYVPWEVQSE